MLVKICGIKTIEALNVAVDSGADYIGFVFAESKRKISPENAAALAKSIPSSVKKVGVFVNETVDHMKKVAEQVGLDVIQLHGDEPAEVAEELPYEIIKAFPAEKEAFKKLTHYPCDYYLLDTSSKEQRGGTGTRFDWAMLEDVGLDHSKLILAGGLTPENVREGIEKVQPYAVDVSSGVETDGEKDNAKIIDFIKNAKQTREE